MMCSFAYADVSAKSLVSVTKSGNFTLCFQSVLDKRFPIDEVDVGINFRDPLLHYECIIHNNSQCADLHNSTSSVCEVFTITVNINLTVLVWIPQWQYQYLINATGVYGKK